MPLRRPVQIFICNAPNILACLLFMMPGEVIGVKLSAIADTTDKSGKLTGSISSDNTKMADEALRANVRDVMNSVRHLQETFRGLISEVTRQNYVSVMQPNVIGSMVLPSVPTQIAMGDYLPPREKYMRFFAIETQSLLGRVSQAMTFLPADWDNDKILDGQMAQVKAGVETLKEENQSLQLLLNAASYDNLVIGKQVLLMSDQVDKMEKLLKKAEKRIQKLSRRSQ